MEERELSWAAALASVAVALLVMAGAGPAEWTLDLALAPGGFEFSASAEFWSPCSWDFDCFTSLWIATSASFTFSFSESTETY